MKRILVVLCAVALVACITPYQPMSYDGGYRDAEVSPGIYEVYVAGNGYTEMQTLTEYFHRRAAEICNANGFKHYDFEMETKVVTTPGATRIQENAYLGTMIIRDRGAEKGRVLGYIRCMHTDPRERVGTDVP